MSGEDGRTLLVDASVFITLAEVGSVELLRGLDGEVVVPDAVAREITDEPGHGSLEDAAHDDGWIRTTRAAPDYVTPATAHLGRDESEVPVGDVALLATALAKADCVVITDDKPLRKTCKALSIPLSGSIGVLVRAVERGDLAPEEAKNGLEAMDAVGARLSASLLRRAERLIDAAAEETEG